VDKMSFIIGKLSRKVSKQHKEYFVGKLNIILPARAAWKKDGQDEICIFLDVEKVNFISQQNDEKQGTTAPAAVAPEEQKQE